MAGIFLQFKTETLTFTRPSPVSKIMDCLGSLTSTIKPFSRNLVVTMDKSLTLAVLNCCFVAVSVEN